MVHCDTNLRDVTTTYTAQSQALIHQSPISPERFAGSEGGATAGEGVQDGACAGGQCCMHELAQELLRLRAGVEGEGALAGREQAAGNHIEKR